MRLITKSLWSIVNLHCVSGGLGADWKIEINIVVDKVEMRICLWKWDGDFKSSLLENQFQNCKRKTHRQGKTGGRTQSVIVVANGEGWLWICASIGREICVEAWQEEKHSRGKQWANNFFWLWILMRGDHRRLGRWRCW